MHPFFKRRTPPARRLAKAAYLSQHAIIVVVIVIGVGVVIGIIDGLPPPLCQLNTAKLKRLHQK